jgi:hypothetical protein
MKMTMVHDATCTCRSHPLPAALGVREARDLYLAENGFTTASYSEPRAQGSILGWSVSVPNPPAHQRAIRAHDLHHVATGYGTDHAGEAELSVWQAQRGLRRAGLYVASIVIVNVAVGMLVSPRRTLGAWAADGGDGSLFSAPEDYERLLQLTVGELRALLELQRDGLATGRRGLHARAP